MRRIWNKIAAVAAAACLAAGALFCAAGCSGGKSGTSYQYSTSSFTETYNLYDDGTYERHYDGPEYSGSIALETGTYTISSQKVSFSIENRFKDSWPGGVFNHSWFSSQYSGTLKDDGSLYISYTTYKKHGSVYSVN